MRGEMERDPLVFWFVVVIAVLLVLGIGDGVLFGFDKPPAPPISQPAPACFVTGLGIKLCGDEAIAYCSIHYHIYIVTNDVASQTACDATGYRR